MIVTIALARSVMDALPRATAPDLRFSAHYAAGAAMPFPVIMDHEHGWAFLAVFFGFVAVMAALSVVAARSLRGAGSYAPALLAGGVIVVVGAMTLFPITFSVDAYAYAAFGRLLGVHGLNPYVERLGNGSTLGDGVLSQLVSLLGTPLPDENYGPLWTWLSALLAFLSQAGGVAAAVWAQRAAGAAALVVAVFGMLRLLRSESPGNRASRAAFFGLHPLALYESAAAGHNDMLMIAPAVWSFATVDELPIAAGVLAGAAVAVKYVALLALPFLVIRAFRSGGLRAAAAVTLPALLVPLILFAPLWPGWSALGTIFNLGGTLIMSPMWLVDTLIGSFGSRAVGLIFALGFALVCAYSIVLYARDRCGFRVFASVAALLWSSPLLNPWYVQWLLPAAASTGRWARYAWWFGLFVMLRYVEDALRYPSTQSELSQRIVLLEGLTIVILAAPVILSFVEKPAPQRVASNDA